MLFSKKRKEKKRVSLIKLIRRNIRKSKERIRASNQPQGHVTRSEKRKSVLKRKKKKVSICQLRNRKEKAKKFNANRKGKESKRENRKKTWIYRGIMQNCDCVLCFAFMFVCLC